MVVAALVVTSCFKDEEYNSDLIIKNSATASSDGDTVPLSGVEIYAFSPFETLIDDKSDEAYEVTSYEDAVAGILTNSVTGESKSYSATSTAVPFSGSYSGYEDALLLNVQGERVFIIAIDTVNQDYAYANYSVGLNLATTYISLSWLTWRTGYYSYGIWTFYSN